jgi:hypothetical protein
MNTQLHAQAARHIREHSVLFDTLLNVMQMLPVTMNATLQAGRHIVAPRELIEALYSIAKLSFSRIESRIRAKSFSSSGGITKSGYL